MPRILNFLFSEGPEGGSLVEVKSACEKSRCPGSPDLCSAAAGPQELAAKRAKQEESQPRGLKCEVWDGLVSVLMTMRLWSWKVQGRPYRDLGHQDLTANWRSITSRRGLTFHSKLRPEVCHIPGSGG